MLVVTPNPSLRERSKVKRRRAIQRAALKLFAERGYDGATIADIADLAEVAPRTITMYFPTKLDIAMSYAQETASDMTAAFYRNPDLSFIQVLDIWLQGEAGSVESELAALTTAMVNANPPLKAAFNSILAEAFYVGEAAFLAEVGLPEKHPLRPIVQAVMTAALTAYLGLDASGDRRELHQSFMRYLSAIIAASRLD